VVLADVRKRATGRLGRVSNDQLVRAVWLGVLIGVVAGVGAIAFFESIEFATEHLLHDIAGYKPPAPLGEGTAETSGPTRAWALPLLLAAGGLVSGLIVYLFAPEAEGHGTDAAIAAFHHKGGRTRVRAVPVKLIASSITIGSGGAAGREGPTAQIGGGFGSFIADQLRLGAVERRKALAAGMGAGIGAIFRAPLGGAMMGAEVLYKHDFEADVILMGLISSIVAFSIFGGYSDYVPIFAGGSEFKFDSAAELPWYAGLGVVCGLMGILYARTFYGAMGLFGRVRIPRILKPAIGGAIVGSIGIAAPESIHVGYGYVQQMFTEQGVRDFSLVLLLGLPFLRIATTSLTVGSGGSGGIFGPGMVIGGFTGAAAWRLFNGMPGFPDEPGPVVIIGMVAMFGSVAHAPLAMLLMVGEMTGNLSLLAPAMVAVAVATLLVGDTTIYRNQVDTRADSPAHRDRFAFPLLSALPSSRAVVPVPSLERTATAQQALEAMQAARIGYAVVLDDQHRLAGDLRVEVVRAAEPEAQVAGLVEAIPAVLVGETPLDEALDTLAAHERRWLPVTDGEGGPVLGAIDTRALMRSYRRAVQSQVRPLTPVTDEVNSMEVKLPDDSPVVGRTLANAGFPVGVRVLTIHRGSTVVVPHGETELRPGDTLTVTFPAATRRRVFSLLLGT
jgi:CIC family chloride channel protein